jgi:hypothetical protein
MTRECQVAGVYKGQPKRLGTLLVFYSRIAVSIETRTLWIRAIGQVVEQISALSSSEAKPNQTEVDPVSPGLATPEL